MKSGKRLFYSLHPKGLSTHKHKEIHPLGGGHEESRREKAKDCGEPMFSNHQTSRGTLFLEKMTG